MDEAYNIPEGLPPEAYNPLVEFCDETEDAPRFFCQERGADPERPAGFPVLPSKLSTHAEFKKELKERILKSKSSIYRTPPGPPPTQHKKHLKNLHASLDAILKDNLFRNSIPCALAVILQQCCASELAAKMKKGTRPAVYADADLATEIADLYIRYTGQTISYANKSHFCQLVKSAMKAVGVTLSLSGTSKLIKRSVAQMFWDDTSTLGATLVTLSYDDIKMRGGPSAIKGAGYRIFGAIARFKIPRKIYDTDNDPKSAAVALLYSSTVCDPQFLFRADVVENLSRTFGKLTADYIYELQRAKQNS
jgi:hypothetical protein